MRAMLALNGFICEVAQVQFMFCSYEAISFILRIYSFQIYNSRFEINVGVSGTYDMTKYLKLSKITNFLWQGPEDTQKLLFFTIFISSQ